MPKKKVFCRKCGAALVEGAAFCSKCGAPVASTATQPPPAPPRSEYRREKEEKAEKHEKEEKHEKGEKAEKGGDRTGAIVGGSIVIWLGISFYLAQINIITWASWWAYFLSGLGVIIILQGLARYSQSGYRHPLTGSLIGGAVCLAVGLAFIGAGPLGMRDFWPIILVVIGIAIIVSAITARSRAPRP